MRKHEIVRSILTALLALSLLLVSCEEEKATASLRINLDPTVRASRAIVPDGIPLDVAKYRIEGTGPSGQTFTITTTRHQATVDGLALGRWTLKATGLNSEELPIVTGQNSFTLTPSTRSCVIHVNNLVGKGSLSVTIGWKKNIVENPRVVLSLTPQSGDKITAEPAVSGTGVTWTKDSLPAGSYIFQAQLYSGKFLMAGLTEAVRIIDQNTSSKSLTFSIDDFPYSPGSLQIYDSTGTPINCVIRGLDAEVESGKTLHVTLQPEEATAEPISVKWYLDGNECGEGASTEFACQPGNHRLDAVAYTSKIGSYGSASVSFEAVIRTDVGVPGNGRRYTAVDGLKLGADTAVTYADNSLIIVSGANDSLQVTDLLRNEIEIKQSYGASTLGALAWKPLGIAVTGSPIDPDGSYGLFMTTNSETNGVKLTFDPVTRTIAQVQTTGNVEYPEVEGMTEILEHTARIKWDESKMDFVTLVKTKTLANGPDDRDRTSMNLAVRKVSQKAVEEYFADFSYDLNFRYDQIHSGETYMNACTFGVSQNGLEYLTAEKDGRIQRGVTEYWEDTVSVGLFRDTCLTPSKYQNAKAIEYSKAGNAYIAGATYLGVLDPKGNKELQYLPLAGSVITDALINPETEHIYVLDSTGRKVITWTIGPDGMLSQMKETAVGGVYTNMAISQDGSEMALWNSADCDAVEILRIRTKPM